VGDAVANKHIQWLDAELPDLVARGVLTSDAADAIRRHYGEANKDRWPQIALVLSTILGAVLVGLGIIFLVAHNWSDFGRPVRAVLAILPLAAAQALVAWVAWCRPASVTWREGAATFLTLALAAAVALVQQTYNAPGSPSTIILMVMCLALPLVYLLRATGPAVLYLAGSILWAVSSRLEGAEVLYLWLLGMGVLPHFVLTLRADRYGLRSVLLAWAIAVWAIPAFGWIASEIPHGYAHEHLWCAAFAGLFAIMYLVGTLWFGEVGSIWRRPFHLIGAGGVALAAYLLTFKFAWEQLPQKDDLLEPVCLCLLGGAALVAAGLCVAAVLKRQPGRIVFGIAPVLALAALGLSAVFELRQPMSLIFNAYVLALAVTTLVSGVRQRRLALANAGVLLVALLVVARLFDSELGLLVRGIACMVIGVGFLATNLVMLRRRKARAR
jgi:uncharacterized membrane protein